jgi:hypothetical protein
MVEFLGNLKIGRGDVKKSIFTITSTPTNNRSLDYIKIRTMTSNKCLTSGLKIYEYVDF